MGALRQWPWAGSARCGGTRRKSEEVSRKMPGVSPERLAEVFVEVADTLVDDFDLIEFLQMLSAHTSDLVEARAAGLLLADQDDRLQLMAASDERAQMIELFQVQRTRVPARTASPRAGRSSAPISGTPRPLAAVRAPCGRRRLPVGARLPAAAAAEGDRGAQPLRHHRRGDAGGSDGRIVQALADVATIGLLQQRAIHERELLSQQLQTALTSRITIEQAKGALAQIHGLTPDEAFTVLRAYCRSHNRRLGDVAAAVVHDPTSVADLTAPGMDLRRATRPLTAQPPAAGAMFWLCRNRLPGS